MSIQVFQQLVLETWHHDVYGDLAIYSQRLREMERRRKSCSNRERQTTWNVVFVQVNVKIRMTVTDRDVFESHRTTA